MVGIPPDLFGDLGGDIRHSLRRLRRSPWATAVIVATLAIVIGANTTIFGVAYGIFLRRLPGVRPQQLVDIHAMNHGGVVNISWAQFRRLPSDGEAPTIAAHNVQAMQVELGGDRTPLWGDIVSGNFFPMLGVQAALGRLFVPADDSVTTAAAVVSWEFWQQRMHGDSSAVGRTLRINDRVVTLIGVTAAAYHGIYFAHRFDIAITFPVANTLGAFQLNNFALQLIGRLPGSMSRARAASVLQPVLLACCSTNPFSTTMDEAAPGPHISPPGDCPCHESGSSSSDKRWHVDVDDARTGLTWDVDYRESFGRVMLELGAGALMLLLIACANIATIQLARAASRRRELAVRASLGASRIRIARQLLAESTLLAVAGALGGVFVARAGMVVLLHELPDAAAGLRDAITWHFSPAIAAFTLVTSLAAVLGFGLLPALRAARADLRSALHDDRAASTSTRRWSTDNLLVSGQVALTIALVACAALFVTTLRQLSMPAAEYGTDRIVLGRLQTLATEVPRSYMPALRNQVVPRLLSVPGVAAVSVSAQAPYFYYGTATASFRIQGHPETFEHGVGFRANYIDQSFMNVAGVRIVAGRSFTKSEVDGGGEVAVISERIAKRYFQGRDPIGQTLTDHDKAAFRIVGVATDASYDEPRSPPTPMVYLPLGDDPWGGGTMIVRFTSSPGPVLAGIRAAIAPLEPAVSLVGATSLAKHLDDILVRERLAAMLALLFGGLALLLSLLGLYGLLAYQTALRTREIGIRMALGASARNALGLVFRHTTMLTAFGVAAGIPLAFAITRAIRSQLYGIEASDPRVFAGSTLALMLAGMIAAIVPAHRATKVDPMVALRSE